MKLTPYDTARAYWKEVIQEYDCHVLSVEADDFNNAAQLPDHHVDPFDRIIIAQALRTHSEIVTYDDRFSDYSVTLHD